MAKRVSIILNVVLIVGILGYVAYQYRPWAPEDPWVVHSSASPDGKWRCTVTDVCPARAAFTLVYSIEPVTGLALSGTRYVSYEDSGLPGEPTFEWSDGRLVVRDGYKTLQVDFGDSHQHWQRLRREEDSFTSPAFLPGAEIDN
jgi:hypothetical protein